MLKNLLVLLSLLVLTACQSVPVKTVEIQDLNLPIIIDDDRDNDGVLGKLDKCPDTPLNVVVNEQGCPVEIICDYPSRPELRVFYSENNSYPKDQYFSEIKKIAEKMQEFPQSFITIEGHTSRQEKDPDNVSRERAFIIAQILKEKYGISENRMSINFYGNQRPIAPNDTKEGRAMNQRVYAIIHPTKPILNP